MAAITIRNLPDEVVEALKKRAKRNARSMEAEARDVLTRAADGESKIERAAIEAVRMRRWSVSGLEINERVALNPAPDVDTTAWIEDIRNDGDIEDFRDPWEHRASS